MRFPIRQHNDKGMIHRYESIRYREDVNSHRRDLRANELPASFKRSTDILRERGPAHLSQREGMGRKGGM